MFKCQLLCQSMLMKGRIDLSQERKAKLGAFSDQRMGHNDVHDVGDKSHLNRIQCLGKAELILEDCGFLY